MSDRNTTYDGLDACRALAARIREIVLFVRRSDRRIIEANEAAQAAYGYTRDELLQRKLADLRAPGEGDESERFFDSSGASDVLWEDRHQRKDGTVFPVELSSQAWLEHGEAYVLYIIRDATEHRRVEERLTRARDRALNVSQKKSEFVAMTSHEIRNPMSVIVGMAELLLETDLSDEQRSYARAVLSSAQTLVKLMSDVLDLSKIEAGKVSVEECDFSLRAIFEEVCTLVRAQAKTKGVAVRFEIASDVPDALYGDAQKLRQILLNLGTNALKFTDQGAIVLSAHSVDFPNGLMLRFEVNDSGIGIDPSRVRTLFEPYQQDRSHGRNVAGTGLGLAIARKLVELLGGEIGVESRLGIGSTFWFTARFGIGSVPLPEPPQIANIWKSSDVWQRRGHVLIVEDIVPNQQIALAQLGRLGYSADVVGNGLDAVHAAESGRYDVILMDIQLPELDGFEATARIRAMDVRQVPIIAMTAGATSDDRRRCFSVGMNDFLSKPVRLTDLETALARAIASPVTTSHASIDTARLEELFDGDRGAIKEVIELAMTASRNSLARLRREVEAHDSDGAASAHQLRGTAFNIGATSLATLAGKLQAEISAGRFAAAAKLLDECEEEFRNVSTDSARFYGSRSEDGERC